ncbi:MAG: 2-hydroxy-3-oxopropionate reductase [Actinomycetota bacterium]|jgi:3-hydroxyisobutyrate dehydrogenase-like beta-hydroxyacid dehydrogenase|nr:2-hydroxy-3-oxopropionate reductase [Actinomycetota bacterium]MDQ1670566.1 2-hydroxy-3-oxopropionate reductase [Actinomycetota bacterium]
MADGASTAQADAQPPGAAVVAVVGLGAMGGPIAGHLAAVGLRPLLLDLDQERVQTSAQRGGVPADQAAVAGADVVIVTVPDEQAVRACCLDTGLVAALKPAAVLCIASSVRPEICLEIAAATGVADVLDTALTGGVRGAEAGTVNLLVGGDGDALARARWALEPWTATIHRLGPLGAGQVAKTCNNMLHWAQICAITESLELGRRHGLDIRLLRRALLDSPVASRTLAELEQMRFTWHAKDLANAVAAGAQVGHDLPVARQSRQLMPGISVDYVRELLDHELTPQAYSDYEQVTKYDNG